MRAEILSGVERRRRWSEDEKARIIAETLGEDVNVSAVARRYGISRSLLFAWRRRARTDSDAPSGLVPVMVADASETVPVITEQSEIPIIELDFESGARLRVFASADASMVKAVIEAMTRQ